MNKRKMTPEEIKYLIPDYIKGTLSVEEKELVEKAIQSSSELKEFYEDTKYAITFIAKVKFNEPAPQYWNNLLPRIHQRIEDKERSKFFVFKRPLSLAWKIVLPVAAVILLFVIYRIATAPAPEYTNKQKVVQTDTAKSKVNENKSNELKKETNVDENNTAENQKSNEVTKNRQVREKNYKSKVHYFAERNKKNIRNEENNEGQLNEEQKNALQTDSELTNLDIRETQLYSDMQTGILDEETENELDRLPAKEKDKLLSELENSNL